MARLGKHRRVARHAQHRAARRIAAGFAQSSRARASSIAKCSAALASLALCCSGFLTADAVAAAGAEVSAAKSVCDLIAASAQSKDLPVTFLTRLIWQESSFRPDVVSSAGARGIAQFMPMTADERGLADPFDPKEAIPKAAELLADLKRRFGNLGLAAAAYNAGAARVANWLAGHGNLPEETRNYVLSVTQHPVEDWSAGAAAKVASEIAKRTDNSETTCLAATLALRRSNPEAFATSAFVAPWGVQLAGNFSKAAALASYERAKMRYAAILGNVVPMILRNRTIGIGFRPYYRIRAPAPTRVAANALCRRIEHVGGACVVLRN